MQNRMNDDAAPSDNDPGQMRLVHFSRKSEGPNTGQKRRCMKFEINSLKLGKGDRPYESEKEWGEFRPPKCAGEFGRVGNQGGDPTIH
jgi:hypothetical protein